MRQTLLIILLSLTSCFSPFNDKQKLKTDDIDHIEISKQFDSVSLHLTNEQVADFVEDWNDSWPKGPYKFLPEYTLTVYFKADSSLSFRTNSNLIKQRSDWAYSVADKEYFKKIWLKQVGLTKDYFEYAPTYFINNKFETDRKPLTEKQLNGIKQVLTFYKHEWKEIRGQLFYRNKIDSELLWNYTTKAGDSIWLSSHK